MPKIEISKITPRLRSGYPPAFKDPIVGREKYPLGDAAGLTQFGVNLTRLKPGAASAQRHWHEVEDELIFVIEGEIVLIEDAGETLLRPGDAAGFKAGVADGHHLVNKSGHDALYLEIGTRSPVERSHYPDVDLVGEKDEHGYRFKRKSGEPYSA
jgi:uncharacterized cupin superfamily protein